jgi:probable rRNA maturation factor
MPIVALAVDLPGEIDTDLMIQAAEAALAHQGFPRESEMTVVLSDDAQLHDLNRQFSGIDAPTDVLSFPAGELDPESGATYLGDIIISGERAVAQAKNAGHPVMQELQLLVVHGVLHLLGHDHAQADEKARMWADQAAILAALGIEIHPE